MERMRIRYPRDINLDNLSIRNNKPVIVHKIRVGGPTPTQHFQQRGDARGRISSPVDFPHDSGIRRDVPALERECEVEDFVDASGDWESRCTWILEGHNGDFLELGAGGEPRCGGWFGGGCACVAEDCKDVCGVYWGKSRLASVTGGLSVHLQLGLLPLPLSMGALIQ
jgi:hypothetical protein